MKAMIGLLHVAKEDSGAGMISRWTQSFEFCLRTSTHFCITSTDEVAWPQGDEFLGGGMWHTGPGPSFPKSAPARFGCKQRKACNNTGVGYGGAVSTRSGGTPVRTVRAELACLSLSAERSGARLTD